MILLRNGLQMRKTGDRPRTGLTETFAFLCGFSAEFITRSRVWGRYTTVPHSPPVRCGFPLGCVPIPCDRASYVRQDHEPTNRIHKKALHRPAAEFHAVMNFAITEFSEVRVAPV
jgi:hypothetical protein